jgi:hypothetical protein
VVEARPSSPCVAAVDRGDGGGGPLFVGAVDLALVHRWASILVGNWVLVPVLVRVGNTNRDKRTFGACKI